MAEEHYKRRLAALLTILGIGRETAILLLCITDGFLRFPSARQLASYVCYLAVRKQNEQGRARCVLCLLFKTFI
ncbi:IS110 family transposase [Aliifodinibius halophilus]|uniref:IS110 family transposase n=1 Tax=Fodinibius halophilus TaxID=1736908 RepID=A0A6M1SZS9_9BACT|nr:IS110 family transposase [Fodinibius halophilus]